MAADLDIYSNKNFKWTQANDQTIEDAGVPRVVLTEFENKTDVLMQNILLLATNVADTSINTAQNGATTFNDIYKGFYKIVPTGRTITLPYIGKYPFHLETTYKMIDPNNSEYSQSIGPQWEALTSSFKNALSRGWRDMINGLGAAVKNSDILRQVRPRDLAQNGYRTGTVTSKQAPKAYESSNFGQFSTTFNLINETPEFSKNHYYFIRRMLDALVPSYIDPMRIQVPYIYSIQIKNLLSLPLGFIASFDAKPMGSAKQVDGIYTPEAWQISMSFNSLFPISYQLLQELDNPTFNSVDPKEQKFETWLAGDEMQAYRKNVESNMKPIPSTTNYSANEG